MFRHAIEDRAVDILATFKTEFMCLLQIHTVCYLSEIHIPYAYKQRFGCFQTKSGHKRTWNNHEL